MVKHIILWQLKDELSEAQKTLVKLNAQTALEDLIGKVPGLLEIKVHITGLASSNVDMMLDSTLESEDALKKYAVHPDHVLAADTYVRPYTKSRFCMDFEA